MRTTNTVLILGALLLADRAGASQIPLILSPQRLMDELPDLVVGDFHAPCVLGGGWSAVRTFCHLDTGGAASRVLKGPFSSFYFPASAFDSRRRDERGVSGQSLSKELVWLPGLQLGGHDLGLRVFDRVALPAGAFGTARGQPALAQIALDIFSGADFFSFHFEGGSARLGINEAPAPATLESLLKRDEAGRLVIPIGLGAERVTAVFDTGSQLSLIDEAYARARPGFFERVAELTVADAGGKQIASQSLYRSRLVVIGEQPLEGAYFIGMDFGKFIYKENLWDRLARLFDPANTISFVRARRQREQSPGSPESAPLVPEPAVVLKFPLDGGRPATVEAPTVILGFNLLSSFNWHFDPSRGLWSARLIAR